MHNWNDDWPHWNDLHHAIAFIQKWATRLGRIGLHGKEKYGSFRDQGFNWDGTLYGLICPGYVYIRWPRWLYWNIDYEVIRRFTVYSGIYWLVSKYQAFIWNAVVQIACRRWPNVIEELLVHQNRYEWVRPGIFGRVNGTEIHNKHWTRVE